MKEGRIGHPCKESFCPEIVPDGFSYCSKHKHLESTHGFTRKNRTRLKVYGSAAWRRARTYKLSINPLCEGCGTQAATEVHHVAQARTCQEGIFNADNLQALCRSCHARESQRESRLTYSTNTSKVTALQTNLMNQSTRIVHKNYG